MPLSHINPTQTNAWKRLQRHFSEQDFNLRDLFKNDPDRFSKFSIKQEEYIFDYSKNLISEETIDLLIQLAEECDLSNSIQKLFSGDKINETENRSVLHTALRDFSDDKILVDGKDIEKDIRRVLQQMKDFSEKVISGQHKGFTGKEITDIVNIGIGGSYLGPVMVCNALKHYKTRLNSHFVSNIDGNDLAEVLKKLNPETTLFIVSSKTFTTQETVTNAFSARNWFLNYTDESKLHQHFVAISTNTDEVESFGINKENIFQFWDWTGGRYSLWSAIGLSIVLSVGYENYIKLLKGGYQTDLHFKETSLDKNVPVLMGLLGIWYRNFFDASSHAVLPYNQYLNLFPSYLRQADMESNGKSVDRSGNVIDYETGPIIWGEAGTNGQHSFYQLIHQGTELVPSDFICYAKSCNPIGDHQEKLVSNFLAQTCALAFGKTEREVKEDLLSKEITQEEIEKITPYKIFYGNIPTNSFLFDELNPFSLGQLIALYEHKIFVQGIIWNIFSFDQWGVELGKALADHILPHLKNQEDPSILDSSTSGLINYYKTTLK